MVVYIDVNTEQVLILNIVYHKLVNNMLKQEYVSCNKVFAKLNNPENLVRIKCLTNTNHPTRATPFLFTMDMESSAS